MNSSANMVAHFLSKSIRTLQVKSFYILMAGEAAPSAKKIAIYRDSWGIRKLVTHVLRNLRSDRIPREPQPNLECIGGWKLWAFTCFETSQVRLWNSSPGLQLWQGPACPRSGQGVYPGMVPWSHCRLGWIQLWCAAHCPVRRSFGGPSCIRTLNCISCFPISIIYQHISPQMHHI